MKRRPHATVRVLKRLNNSLEPCQWGQFIHNGRRYKVKNPEDFDLIARQCLGKFEAPRLGPVDPLTYSIGAKLPAQEKE